MNKLTVSVPHEVPFDRIADLLTSAFEGGSNYWIESAKKFKPVQWDFLSNPDLGREEGEDPQVYLCDYPLNPGGHLVITINEPFDDAGTEEYTLNISKIKKGLQTFMSGGGFGKEKDGTERKVMRHASAFLAENDDAETADVFLQICLFGEVIFG